MTALCVGRVTGQVIQCSSVRQTSGTAFCSYNVFGNTICFVGIVFVSNMAK